jgi:hypothetical protein
MRSNVNIEGVKNEFKGNKDWVLPIDIKLSENTSDFEFKLVTKALLEGKNRPLATTF